MGLEPKVSNTKNRMIMIQLSVVNGEQVCGVGNRAVNTAGTWKRIFVLAQTKDPSSALTNKITVQTRPLLDILREVVQSARVARAVLASWYRYRSRIYQNPHKRTRRIVVSFSTRSCVRALQPLKTDVTQERENVACSPRSLVIDFVGRHRAVDIKPRIVSGVVEKSECGEDKWWLFAMAEGDVQCLRTRGSGREEVQ